MPDQGQLQPQLTAAMILGAQNGLRAVVGGSDGAGSGYTVSQIVVPGGWRVTFNPPFSATPRIVYGPVSGPGRGVNTTAKAATGFDCRVFEPETDIQTDGNFDFVAIGPA